MKTREETKRKFRIEIEMFSVVETFEDGDYMATAVRTMWLKNGKLYWPPGKNVDRQAYAIPQTDWVKYDYKLLKTGIGKYFQIEEILCLCNKNVFVKLHSPSPLIICSW